MLDFTKNEEDKKYFITNIEQKEGMLIVSRADGTVEKEKFSEHNLGFTRMKMVEQLKTYLGPYMDYISKESFTTYVKKYGSIIGGIVGLYFLYNVDIHIIMKILITALVLIGELGYFIYNEVILTVMWDIASECLAYDFYLKNIKEFMYFDKENYTDGFIVPPEDIANHHITVDMLEQILNNVREFKNQGFEDENISVDYKTVQNKTIQRRTKSMV